MLRIRCVALLALGLNQSWITFFSVDLPIQAANLWGKIERFVKVPWNKSPGTNCTPSTVEIVPAKPPAWNWGRGDLQPNANSHESPLQQIEGLGSEATSPAARSCGGTFFGGQGERGPRSPETLGPQGALHLTLRKWMAMIPRRVMRSMPTRNIALSSRKS